MSYQTLVAHLSDVIKNSNVAYVNKLSNSELQELSGEIASWLESKGQSVEYLFNPDFKEHIEVFNLSAYKQ